MVEMKNLTQPLIDAMDDRLFHRVRHILIYSHVILIVYIILSIPCRITPVRFAKS